MEAGRDPGGELHLVGPLHLAKTFVERYRGIFRHWAHVAKSALRSPLCGRRPAGVPHARRRLGLVIQEAMCSGTPVVTTPCGDGPECITDGVDGWLVPPRDVDALVERFRAAAADRDHAAAVGRAARKRAETWTWLDFGSALVRALAS